MLALAQVPPPSEVLYLELVEKMPLSKWQMLTGLEDTTDPTQLAQKYIEVVEKKLQKMSGDFSDWLTASGVPVTDEQRALAEQVLAEFNAAIQLISVQQEDDGSLTGVYHVVVDPSLAQDVVLQEETPASSPMIPLLVAFSLGAVGTSLLVRKGTGLKLLAGFSGGVFAVVTTASFLKHRAAQEEVIT